MNIKNVSNQDFKGAFRIHKPTSETKAELSTLIQKRGKQIFENFENSGDMFLVLRGKYDRVVAKYLQEKKLPLEYYPKISTSSGLDSQKPEGLSALLKNKEYNRPLTSITQIKKYINNLNRNEYIKKESPIYVDNILKSLCIDNKHEIKMIRGAQVINDREFNRKILISPPSVNNIHYVKILSNINDKNMERYAIDSNGNILQVYKTPESIKKFTERFNSLLLQK